MEYCALKERRMKIQHAAKFNKMLDSTDAQDASCLVQISNEVVSVREKTTTMIVATPS